MVVTVAIPIWQDRVSPVLDTATRLLVITRHRGGRGERLEIAVQSLEPESFARVIAGHGVDILLCAAVSEPLHRALRKQGVRIRAHVCGSVRAVLRAFCCHRLGREEFRMPGCCGCHSDKPACRKRKSASGRKRTLFIKKPDFVGSTADKRR